MFQHTNSATVTTPPRMGYGGVIRQLAAKQDMDKRRNYRFRNSIKLFESPQKECKGQKDSSGFTFKNLYEGQRKVRHSPSLFFYKDSKGKTQEAMMILQLPDPSPAPPPSNVKLITIQESGISPVALKIYFQIPTS